MVLACQVTRRNRLRFKPKEALARNEIGTLQRKPETACALARASAFKGKRRGDSEMADQVDNRGVPLKPAQPIAKSGEWWRPSNLRGSADPSLPPPQKAEPQSEPSS